MSPNRTFLLLFLCCVLKSSCSLNILGLFPHPGKSHFDVFEPLLKALAERGHNLTVVSHFPQKTKLPGYKDISLKGDTDILLNVIPMDEIPKPRWVYYFSPILLMDFAKESCKGLRTKHMQELIKSNEKFDLIVTEMFNTDCFLGFVHKFKAPFIGLSSCTMMTWSNWRFGNPSNPSYIPSNLLPYSDEMSFFERVENALFLIYSDVLFRYFMQNPGYEEAKQHFGEDLPDLEDIANNASLLLVNSHFSLNRPRPLVPNIIEVGGMFLGKPKKLPENLEKFISESKHGVIYFSMGSLIKGHTFPEEKRAAFLQAFSKLKQRVLWKWENESLPEQPNNVMIQKWMPQFDILCHPNVVAFISHGGLLGTTEAVHCGVPLIVMPQFGDQFTNAQAVQASGGGLVLSFNDATEESISEALKTVLEPSFNKRAKDLSAAFRDRPMSPLDTAIYWTEYVARHKGASHMRSAAVGMPLYKYLLLDVGVFLLYVLLAIFVAFYYSIRYISRLIWGAPEKPKADKNKKEKSN